jgi:sigma-E factor negative regulatory protein RseB
VRARSVVVTVAAVTAVAALAGSSAAGTAPRRSDPRALQMLRRAVIEEEEGAFSGTEVLADAIARPDRRRIQVTQLPGRGTLLVELAAPGQPERAAFTPMTVPSPSLLIWLLTNSYGLIVSGRGVVAGRPAVTIDAVRPDGSTAGRFWLDTATGLMLRRDVMDDNGRVLRSIAYVQIDSVTAAPSHLPPVMAVASRLGIDAGIVRAWRARGWNTDTSLAGLTLFDTRLVAGAGSPVLHLSYSDGLSSVSVFVQPGSLDVAALAGAGGMRQIEVGGEPVWAVPGSTEVLTWSAGGHVITVVADAPASTVAAAVTALPHVDHQSAWSRLWRGLHRVASWLNPFG